MGEAAPVGVKRERRSEKGNRCGCGRGDHRRRGSEGEEGLRGGERGGERRLK